jgi:hypothetical protein
MSKSVIHPGQTYALAQNAILTGAAVIQGATAAYSPGGYLIVDRHVDLANDGIIEIDQSAFDGDDTSEGRLTVRGTLTNNGTIALQAALASTPTQRASVGGQVSNTGVLTNAGLIEIGGSGGTPPGQRPSYFPARLTNTGTLINTGTILLQNIANSGNDTGGNGGELSSSGVMINDNTIVAQGGIGDGGSGLLDAAYGTFVNNGALFAQGGAGDRSPAGNLQFGYNNRFGASATNSATGVITLGAGASPASSGGNLLIEEPFSNAGLIEGAATSGYQPTILLLGYLDNTGTIALPPSAGSNLSHADLSLGYLIPGGRGTLHMSASSYLSAAISLDGGTEIFGSGTIAGTMTAKYGVGTLNASGGTLTLNASVGTYIKIGVAAAATLAANGTIASTDTVTLAAATSTLQTTAANAGLRIVSNAGGTLALTGGGTATLNAADTNLTAVLAAPGTLSLGLQGFLTAVAATPGATLVAGAANQTLVTDRGGDTLTGAATDSDTFAGTAAGLNQDTFTNFAGADVIDVTNLMPGAALMLDYAQGAGEGTLTLTEGAQSTTLTLLGTFSPTGFTTKSDGHGGVLIGLH